MKEPLAPGDARRLIRTILDDGSVEATRHALEEMKADGMILRDAINVLRGGVVQPGELRDGTFRYQVVTARITVVVAFTDENAIKIVTAWRNK